MILNASYKPSLEELSMYVNHNLWNELCAYLRDAYEIEPSIEYSSCSLIKGWNLKYKKSGKSLCVLYPNEKRFSVLVVIGVKEKERFEYIMDSMSEYTQKLYKNTPEGKNQRWLLFHVDNQEVLEDIKKCILLRREIKKKI